MSKYTEGPWKVTEQFINGEEPYQLWIQGNKPPLVAVVNLDPCASTDEEQAGNERQRANASLISIAPQMLALLEDMVAEIEDDTTEKGVSLNSYFENRVKAILSELAACVDGQGHHVGCK